MPLHAIVRGTTFYSRVTRRRSCDNDPTGVLSEQSFTSKQFYKMTLVHIVGIETKKRDAKGLSAEITIRPTSNTLKVSQFVLTAKSGECDQISNPQHFWEEFEWPNTSDSLYSHALEARNCDFDYFGPVSSTKCSFELDTQEMKQLKRQNIQCWVLLYVPNNQFAPSKSFIAASKDCFIAGNSKQVDLKCSTENSTPSDNDNVSSTTKYFTKSRCICYPSACIMRVLGPGGVIDSATTYSLKITTKYSMVREFVIPFPGIFISKSKEQQPEDAEEERKEKQKMYFTGIAIQLSGNTKIKMFLQNEYEFEAELFGKMDGSERFKITQNKCRQISSQEEQTFGCYLIDDSSKNYLLINCDWTVRWPFFTFLINLNFFVTCSIRDYPTNSQPSVVAMKPLDDTLPKLSGENSSFQPFQARFSSCQGSKIYYGSAFQLNLVLSNQNSFNYISIKNFTLNSSFRKPKSFISSQEKMIAKMTRRSHFSMTLEFPCKLFHTGKDNITSLRFLLIQLSSAGESIREDRVNCEDVSSMRWMQSGQHQPERWLTSEFYYQLVCPEAEKEQKSGKIFKDNIFMSIFKFNHIYSSSSEI